MCLTFPVFNGPAFLCCNHIAVEQIHTNLTKGPQGSNIKFANLVFERLHVSSFWQEDLIKISAFEKNKITSQVLLSNTTCRSPPIRIITCTMISLTRVQTMTFYWVSILANARVNLFSCVQILCEGWTCLFWNVNRAPGQWNLNQGGLRFLTNTHTVYVWSDVF